MNGDPVVQFGAAQSYECVKGSSDTYRALYNKGFAFLNGTVFKAPFPGDEAYLLDYPCEIGRTTDTEIEFTVGNSTTCPDTLDPPNGMGKRLESALPNLVGKNCMPLYNLNSSSQFMSESNTIPINSTFPTFKNKGGPVGFGGNLVYPQRGPEMQGGGYQTDSGFSYLVYFEDSQFGVEMGQYTSWECTAKDQYIATVEARYFYPDGTVEAEARCEVGRYDSATNNLYYQSSTTACPQANNATDSQEYLEGSGENNACANYDPDPVPSPAPGPAPQPAPVPPPSPVVIPPVPAPAPSSAFCTKALSITVAMFICIVV